MDINIGSDALIGADWEIEDPVCRDLDSDRKVVTTRRAICRVAFVAAETASRFEREGIDYDPMAWMMAPRSLFDGSAPLDACLDRQSFLRAAILHGLSLGLDALPSDIDPLIDDDDDDIGDFDMDPIEEAFAQSALQSHRGRMSRTGAGPVDLMVPRHRTPVYRKPARAGLGGPLVPETADRLQRHGAAGGRTRAKARAEVREAQP
jgi:hypothetical protein